jgi:hypothetical protein
LHSRRLSLHNVFVQRPGANSNTQRTRYLAGRKVVATEARLNKIYEAAKLGLKGDALALASGMLPTEYRQL